MYRVEEIGSQGPVGGGAKAGRYGRAIDHVRLLRALVRRRWWLVGAAVVGVVAGALVAKLVIRPTYEARTIMEWEPEARQNVRELYTLIDSVKLPTNLAAVRERLEISQTLEQLSASIKVDYEPDSNLVTVTASADKPATAVERADTIVEVFLEQQRVLERTRQQEEVVRLETDVDRAREQLRGARDEYDRFRRERGITDLSAERQQAIELAASLRAQADMAEAQASAAPAVRGDAVMIATAVESPRLLEARRQLAIAQARLSEAHPRVQSLAAEVAVLEAESQVVEPRVRSSEGRQRSAMRRREQIEDLMQQAAERLGQLTAVEGEASALLASVQVAEGHILEIEEQLSRSRDAVENPFAGFRIVASAQRPENPSQSLRKPAAAVIAAGVVLLMLIALLGLELRGLRAHTPAEVAYWGRGAVVGATTWPRESSLNALVDEFGELALESPGGTLIVGATPAEEPLARQLVAHLRLLVDLLEPLAPEAVHYDAKTCVSVVEQSTDIVIREPVREEPISDRPYAMRAYVELWSGDSTGPALRRAARRADRVMVVVPSGGMSFMELSQISALVGREDRGLGYVVVGLPAHLTTVPDRIGLVADFWSHTQR